DVTDHCPTKVDVTGSNSPIIELFGVVNQTFPLLSTATKIGWLPEMFGSVKNCGVVDPEGILPSWPGGVPLRQVGAKSQPASANQRLPPASTAVPHGSPVPPGSGYSWIVPGTLVAVAVGVRVGVRVGVAL